MTKLKPIIIEHDCNGDLFVRIPNGPIVRLECPNEDNFVILQKYLLDLIDQKIWEDEVLNMTYDEIEISQRTRSCLKWATDAFNSGKGSWHIPLNCKTIADIISHSEKEIKNIYGYGKVCHEELKGLLTNLNLKFKDDI